MLKFISHQYGSVVSQLVDADRLCELGHGRPNPQPRKALSSLTVEGLFPLDSIRDRDMAACCLAGLWLWHNYLEQSHQVSQKIETPSGSYWHALMHRREPDFSNAKYWFRRVGQHAVFARLGDEARELAETGGADPAARFLTQQASWDPFAFVDLCEAVQRGRAECEGLCRHIARVEWQLLFDYCYQSAIGEHTSHDEG